MAGFIDFWSFIKKLKSTHKSHKKNHFYDKTSKFIVSLVSNKFLRNHRKQKQDRRTMNGIIETRKVYPSQ